MSRGFRGIISYVEFDNVESLKSTRRMGARLFGSIFILGVFGHYLVYRTRGCRKLGVRITWPRPGSDGPSTDPPAPLKFEEFAVRLRGAGIEPACEAGEAS